MNWIASPAELDARLTPRPARIALDTEFIRERTYWPQLALVQIAFERDGALQLLLVDPLVPGMGEVLAPLLRDTSVLKVMHSPSEDLVALRHYCAAVPRPLFDTQTAAALAGLGAGTGYQKLVEQLTGTTLAKGETRSDWLKRPLTPAQLDYAADDVRYLFEMHDALVGMLQPLGRLDWLEEDARRTLDAADTDDTERWPHLSMRSAQFLDVPAQRRLLRLLRWREAYARGNDRPRSWILDNELATLLARTPPPDPTALKSIFDSHPKAPRKLADAVWTALNTPLDDENDAPAAASDAVDKQKLRALQDAVAAVARQHGLPDGVLASRRYLEPLLETGEWPAALSGWRRALLEPALARLLPRQG